LQDIIGNLVKIENGKKVDVKNFNPVALEAEEIK